MYSGFSSAIRTYFWRRFPKKSTEEICIQYSALGGKGAAIIQDLLTLARRGVAISEIIDLNRIVSDYFETPELENLKAYHPLCGFQTVLEKNLLNISGSPVHLDKTLMNLIANAAEAISGRGEVTIGRRTVTWTGRFGATTICRRGTM